MITMIAIRKLWRKNTAQVGKSFHFLLFKHIFKAQNYAQSAKQCKFLAFYNFGYIQVILQFFLFVYLFQDDGINQVLCCFLFCVSLMAFVVEKFLKQLNIKENIVIICVHKNIVCIYNPEYLWQILISFRSFFFFMEHRDPIRIHVTYTNHINNIIYVFLFCWN